MQGEGQGGLFLVQTRREGFLVNLQCQCRHLDASGGGSKEEKEQDRAEARPLAGQEGGRANLPCPAPWQGEGVRERCGGVAIVR